MVEDKKGARKDAFFVLSLALGAHDPERRDGPLPWIERLFFEDCVYGARQRGGRLEYAEFFDEDDLAAARACVERLRSTAAPASAGRRLLERWVDAIDSRDWERALACLTEDFIAVDHRRLATVGRERDRATFIEMNSAIPEHASDVRYEWEMIADLGGYFTS